MRNESNRRRGLHFVEKPEDPLSQYKAGHDAATLKRILGPTLDKEMQSIISELAGAKPDLGTYAHLAGRAFMLNKLSKAVELEIVQARDATDQLKSQGISG